MLMLTLPVFLLYAYIFVVGSCIGSFLNVVIYRLPKGISIAKGRSFCPNCKHSLGALDLVPFFSWIFLGGKCRYCKSPISIRYFFVEALGGVFAVISALRFGLSWGCLFAFAFFSVIICISFIDIDTLEIPNGLLLWLVAPAVFFAFSDQSVSLAARAVGFIAISLPMFLLTIAIPDCFGGGDIKLIAVCGFLLGWKNAVLAAFIAIVSGGIYGALLLATKNATGKSRFAFGPFLCIGAAAAFLFGDKIIAFYMTFFK